MRTLTGKWMVTLGLAVATLAPLMTAAIDKLPSAELQGDRYRAANFVVG